MNKQLVFGALMMTATLGYASPQAHALLQTKQEVTLSSQVGGLVQSIPVEDGGAFKKGQELLRFDCTMQKAELGKAEATFDQARAMHKTNLRLKKLHGISKTEFSQGQLNLKIAKADVNMRKHAVNLCRLNAPFAGRMIMRHVKPSQTVAKGQPLLDIINNHNLRVDLIIPSQWLTWIRPGKTFTLRLNEYKRPIQAKITQVLPKVDPVSQTVRVIGVITTKDNHLVSGMSGTADFSQGVRKHGKTTS